MKKTKIVALVVAVGVAFGGLGVFLNQTFAATEIEVNEAIPQSVDPNNEAVQDSSRQNEDSNSEVVQELTPQNLNSDGEILADPLPDQSNKIERIDVEEVKGLRIPLDLAERTTLKSNDVTNNPISKKKEVQARNTADGNQTIVFYELEDGKHEILIAQSDNNSGDEAAAVEEAKSWYDPSDVLIQQVNGHTAVIENAENRVQIHLITNSHFFTVASPGTQNLDYLLEIASEIPLD